MSLRYDRSIIDGDVQTLQEVVDIPLQVHTCRLRHENVGKDGELLPVCPIQIRKQRIGCAHSVIRQDVREILGRFCEEEIVGDEEGERLLFEIERIDDEIKLIDFYATSLTGDGREEFSRMDDVKPEHRTLSAIRDRHTELTAQARKIVINLFQAGKKFLQST